MDGRCMFARTGSSLFALRSAVSPLIFHAFAVCPIDGLIVVGQRCWSPTTAVVVTWPRWEKSCPRKVVPSCLPTFMWTSARRLSSLRSTTTEERWSSAYEEHSQWRWAKQARLCNNDRVDKAGKELVQWLNNLSEDAAKKTSSEDNIYHCCRIFWLTCRQKVRCFQFQERVRYGKVTR